MDNKTTNASPTNKPSNHSTTKRRTRPRPHKPWKNTANSHYYNPPLSPIMVLMDNNSDRSPVHASTPVLMSPIKETHSNGDHLSVNKKQHAKIPSYTSQFKIKLNMKASNIKTNIIEY
eukprot:369006_1